MPFWSAFLKKTLISSISSGLRAVMMNLTPSGNWLSAQVATTSMAPSSAKDVEPFSRAPATSPRAIIRIKYFTKSPEPSVMDIYAYVERLDLCGAK